MGKQPKKYLSISMRILSKTTLSLKKCWDRWQFWRYIVCPQPPNGYHTMANTICRIYLWILSSHPRYLWIQWPFQIITKDYWNGWNDRKTLQTTVKDFVDFALVKNKLISMVKSVMNDSPSIPTYSSFWFLLGGKIWCTIQWIIRINNQNEISNWWKRWYVFTQHEPAYSGVVRHGLMPMFIKTSNEKWTKSIQKSLGQISCRCIK